MSTYRHFRKKFGLGQKDLAMFLGVNRISIIRMEKGRGVLNTGAWLKLDELEKCLNQAGAKPAKQNTEQTAQYCRRLETNCAFRLASLKRKLRSMQERWEKVGCLRCLLDQVNAGSDKQTREWLQLQTIRTERMAHKCNETDQAALQVLITMCAAELAAVRKYMRRNKIRPTKTNI